MLRTGATGAIKAELGGCSVFGELGGGLSVDGPSVDEAGEGSRLGSEVDGRVHPMHNPPHKPRR